METQHQKILQMMARDLVVSYGNYVALNCSDLNVSGKCIAVVGHNGAGKSTLIKSLLGLLPITNGSITLRDQLTERTFIPEKDMAFCPETGSVFADIKVESYIKFWCRIKHGNDRYYKEAGKKYIELLELAPLLSKLGRELSKGQRRRVQTAIGFFTKPRVFLFDEPFDGLDVLKTTELAHIIQNESEHINFIISSHRMDVIERLADIVIVLKEGEVVVADTVENVCHALSGDTFLLSNLNDRSTVLEKVKELFPHHLINHLGEIVSITGEGNDDSKIKQMLHTLGESKVIITGSRSTLTDAVNYHLKTLNLVRTV